jgi:hypothetical protein
VGPCDLPLKSVQTISNFEFSEFPATLKYPHHIDEFDPLLCSSDFCKGRGNSQNPAHFIWKSFLLSQLDFFEPIKAWILQKKLKTRSLHEILIYWLCTRKCALNIFTCKRQKFLLVVCGACENRAWVHSLALPRHWAVLMKLARGCLVTGGEVDALYVCVYIWCDVYIYIY